MVRITELISVSSHYLHRTLELHHRRTHNPLPHSVSHL